MAFTLPTLPYAFTALEPHIDATTMEIHSQRHHKAYVDNLNKALESAPAQANLDIVALLRDVKAVPESVRQVVINNGGDYIGETIETQVISVKQTSAGRIIFTNAIVEDHNYNSLHTYEQQTIYEHQHD